METPENTQSGHTRPETSPRVVASQCCTKVWDGGRWPSSHQCPRKASVERDGKPYCGIHDPVKRDERSNAKMAQWRADSERQQQAAEWNRAALGVCEGVDIGTLNVLGAGWLKRWLASHEDAATIVSEVSLGSSNLNETPSEPSGTDVE